MAISETITVDAGPGIAGLNAFADAAEKAAAKYDAAMSKLKPPSAAGGGAGADKMAASMDAAAGKISAAVAKVEASLSKLAGAGDAAAGAIGKAGESAAAAGSAFGEAAAGANDFAMASTRAAESADAVAGAMERQAVAGGRARKASAESAVAGERFWKGVKVLAVGGAVAAVYGIDKAMRLQSEVTRLYTAAGLRGVGQGDVTKAVLGIGSRTGFSGQAIAEAMYHPVSAGLDWKSAKGLTEQSANLANIHGANLEDTTYAMSSVMKAYNMSAKQVTPTAALLNSIVGQGDMRFQDFNQSVKNFAPTGASMGISLQSMGAGLAYLTDRGNSAEVASTRLTMGLSMATAGSKAANVYMKDLGLTTGKLDLQNKSLQKTMEKGGLTTNRFAADLKKPDGLYVALNDMQTAFHKAGLSAAQSDQVMAKIFGGGRSDKAIVSLMQNLDGVKQKYDQIGQGVKGYGKSVADEQATAQQKWKDFLATGQNLATGFGNAMLPAFTKIAGLGASLLQGPGGGVTAGLLGGGAALFAGKKLFTGAESALGTVGQVGKFLKIPGLDKLAGIGGGGAGTALASVATSGDAAAAALARVAGAADGAAAGEAKAGGAGMLGAGGKAGAAEAAAVEGGFMSKMKSFGGKALGAAMIAAIAIPIDRQVSGYIQGKLGKKDPGTSEVAQAGVNAVAGAAVGSRFGPLGTAAGGLGGLTYSLATMNTRQSLAPVTGGPGVRVSPTPAGAAFALRQGTGGNLSAAKVPAPDTSAVTAAAGRVKSILDGALSAVTGKKPKIQAPDMSALDSAKGKAQAAGTAITSALTGALGKAVHAKSPDLSAYSSAAGKARADGANISAGLASGILAGEGAVVAAAGQVAAAAAAAMAHAVQSHSPSKKTKKTGKDMTDGLVIGLQGGQDAVNAAASALGKNAAKATDIAAIDNAAKKLLGQVPKGDTALTAMLKADNRDLDRMARTRAKLEQEISDSEQVARSAISGASIMNSLNATNPAGNEPIASAAVVQGQQYQAASMKQFAQQLQKLQKMGLNATELSQIAQAGPDQGLGIAQGITSGGKQAITQLNQLQKQMQGSAAQIGNVAGPAMFQAGKDMGVGLAAGLKSELGSLDKTMEHLAKSMAASAGKHAGHAKAGVAKAAAGAVAGGAAAGASAASGSGAAVSLSAAGASLTSAAAALTSAAAALKRDASGGGVPGAHHPAAHPVAAAASRGGGGAHVHYHQHVNVTVQGTVTAERDLLSTLQQHQLRKANSNWQGGWRLPGRAT